jgi:hypothetical protein
MEYFIIVFLCCIIFILDLYSHIVFSTLSPVFALIRCSPIGVFILIVLYVWGLSLFLIALRSQGHLYTLVMMYRIMIMNLWYTWHCTFVDAFLCRKKHTTSFYQRNISLKYVIIRLFLGRTSTEWTHNKNAN